MKIYILIILLTLLSLPLSGQKSISEVLHSVEKNNSTLRALREEVRAEALDAQAGVALPDPEIGFDLLKKSPAPHGLRRDFSVSQSLDIATLSGIRSKAARAKGQLAESRYRVERQNLLLETSLYCMDIIYYNALIQELERRIEHAGTLAEVQSRRLESGDGTILEYNNATLQLSEAKGELTRTSAERSTMIAHLARLNGGIPLSLETKDFEEPDPLPDFDTWILTVADQSPLLRYVGSEVKAMEGELALAKAERLPSLTAGYMGEFVPDERFNGVTLGISIPLWSGNKRVRAARARHSAATLKRDDIRTQLYANLRILYDRTKSLGEVARSYRTALKESSNVSLLRKALDAGEISLPEYYVEIKLYYDIVTKSLEAERDYLKAYTELTAPLL